MESIGLSIIIYIVSLFILYIVIEAAVKNGINSSIIGQSLSKQSGSKEKTESFLDDDLDNRLDDLFH